MRRQSDLNVVTSEDLTVLARSLGILDDLTAGILGCEFCEEPVDLGTVFAVYPAPPEVSVVCNDPDCIRRFLLHAHRVGLR